MSTSWFGALPFAGGVRFRLWTPGAELQPDGDPLFATDPSPIAVDRQPDGPVVRFARPGGVILRKR
jgi:hypothetical protein